MSQALSTIDKEWLIHQIILWVCDEEKSKEETQKLVVDAVAELTDEGALDLIFEAFEKVAEVQKEQNKPEVIINMHVAVYEAIYQYFKSIDFAAGMNKALRAKEKFLGLINDTNKVVLRKSETIVHSSRPDVEYNTDNLTNEELYELEGLLAKSLVS